MQTQTSPVARPRKLYLPTTVIHPDGHRTAFEIRRISETLSATGRQTGAFDEEDACILTQRVLGALRQRFPASETTTSEIRDLIDEMLAVGAAASAASSATK